MADGKPIYMKCIGMGDYIFRWNGAIYDVPFERVRPAPRGRPSKDWSIIGYANSENEFWHIVENLEF